MSGIALTRAPVVKHGRCRQWDRIRIQHVFSQAVLTMRSGLQVRRRKLRDRCTVAVVYRTVGVLVA
jgi:hypothetical protein